MKQMKTVIPRLDFPRLLMVLLLASLMFLGWRIISTKDEYVEIEIMGSGGEWRYTEGPLPSWLADSIYVGDAEYSLGGKKLAEVVSIKRFEDGPNKIFFAKMRLMVSRNSKHNTFRFRQQPLEIGSFISIAPANKKLTGNVVSIAGVKHQSDIRYATVRIKMYALYPWFAETVKVGDSVRDDSGQELIRILEKKVALAEVTAYTSTGQALARRDPLKRDLELTLKLQVINRSGVDYFAYYQPVKVGNSLYLPMNEYNLYDAVVADVKKDD